MDQRTSESGFSLIELLVVVVIIGILAAIAIPRYLDQRQAAWNSAAVADLRNLVAIETSLEASSAGMSESPATVSAEGWEASIPEVVVCADRQGDDLLLASWHVAGSILYTWRRTDARIATTAGPVPMTCLGAIPGGTPTQLTS